MTDRAQIAAEGLNPGDPLPILDGHVSHGRFERVLRGGHFAISTEIAPPDSADPGEVPALLARPARSAGRSARRAKACSSCLAF